MTDETNLVARPTEEGQAAAQEALAAIRQRSFSGRNPELGKMVKCQVCGRRHRASEVHEQKFAIKNKQGIDYKRPSPAGQTLKGVLGAATFAKRRLRPPLNWRQNLIVQLVNENLPVDENSEFEPEDKTRVTAWVRRRLANRFGRHGFLPSLWRSQKQTRLDKEKNVRESSDRNQDIPS
jgi:hypothetical protein